MRSGAETENIRTLMMFVKCGPKVNHLNLYERASGAKLNHLKTEGVWIGAEKDKNDINIQVKDEIKILLSMCRVSPP